MNYYYVCSSTIINMLILNVLSVLARGPYCIDSDDREVD